MDAVVLEGIPPEQRHSQSIQASLRKTGCSFHSGWITRIESESWKGLSNNHLAQALSPCGCDLFLESQSRQRTVGFVSPRGE